MTTHTTNGARTGWISHERYLWHDSGSAAGFLEPGEWLEPLGHVESVATKRRFLNLLTVSGLLSELVQIEPTTATEEQLLAVHTPEYVSRIKAESAAHGGDAGDGSTSFGHRGFEIALLSAGGVITAVEAVLRGDVRNVYALVRPPGHHAKPEHGMGFCMFNNIGIAVRHAQATHGLGRVAVVDWDVHHGNGTQAVFYEDPDVLTISLHQDRCFPTDSGFVSERGAGPGLDANLNVPLPPGSGRGAYLDAFERAVLPALEAFAPELVIVASGLDANGFDPMARQLLHSDAYRELTDRLMDFTDGRLVVVHEGGYSDFYVPFCGLAVVETLSGKRTPVEDPYLADFVNGGGQELTHDQKLAVDAVVAAAMP